MRRLAVFVLAAALLVPWLWRRMEKDISPLRVSEGVLVDERERPVALRGMSTHGLGWYPRYLNAGAMKTLKDYGANVIRLAMYTQHASGFLAEPRNLDFVYIGIENAIAEGLYVIVDWHILSDGNPLTHMEEAIAFFAEISAHYGNTPNLLYEICNEPNGETTWQDISAYAAMVIPAIRQNAPEAVVLVGTPHYSSRLRDAMASPLPYPNVMYSCHKYMDASAPSTYWLEKALETKFPVFVTEWGVEKGEESLKNAGQFVGFLNDNGISWCGWALSNTGGDHDSFRQDCRSYSGWEWEDLTPGGKLMFASFRGNG